MKIDIRKVFDTLDWGFLLKDLKRFGFETRFCDWVKVILDSTRLSISVNGKAAGYFAWKRGVRQGDPLSPLLFCLAEEVLSKGISKLVANCNLSLMSGPKGVRMRSHFLYADDVLFFLQRFSE